MSTEAAARFQIEQEVVQSLCETIGSPRALTVSMLLAAGEFEQLLDLQIDPDNYELAGDFADDYLVSNVLKKSPNIPFEVDRKAKAYEAFREGNSACGAVNETFASSPKPSWYGEFLRIIKKVLGPLEPYVLEKIVGKMRHGPGATVGVPGERVTPSEKYRRPLTLSLSLMPFAASVLPEPVANCYRKLGAFEVVEASEAFTVPKTTLTDRAACKEPTLNLWVQQGIGAYIMERLGRWGCDLHDQTRNQLLASRAYADGLATLDLSNASNTLAACVVYDCLPPDWFHLLELARMPVILIENGAGEYEHLELEMFSSMGNGYTFPLESLLFFSVVEALVLAEQLHLCSVYGDDIIVPQDRASDVIEALNFLGFKVNIKKSFLAGSFFESCGTDWFKGQEVRPFFLRRAERKPMPYVVEIANLIRLYALKRGGGTVCDARFKQIWETLFALAPGDWRKCKVPPEYAHAGFITDRSEANCREIHCEPTHGSWVDRELTRLIGPPSQEEGWAFAVMRMRAVKKCHGDIAFLLAALAAPVEDRPFTLGFEPIRGLFRRPVIGAGRTHVWPELLWEEQLS